MSMNPNSQWYYSRGGTQMGPIPMADLRAMLAGSQISAGDLVWTEGMAEWTPAGNLPQLRQPMPQAAPVAPSPSFNPQTGAPNPAQYAAPGSYIPPYSGYVQDASRGPSQQGLAIAGFVCSLFFPLLGLIFSIIALNGMKNNRNNEGKGLAMAGLIISIAWFAIGCLWFILVFGVLAAAAGH